MNGRSKYLPIVDLILFGFILVWILGDKRLLQVPLVQ